MTEEILPVGIDSTIEHVEAETGRIDGLFTVPTGSIGAQKVNYHPINEERQRYSLVLPTPEIESPILEETVATSISIKAETSERKEIQTTGAIRTDEEIVKARFSLPEVGNIDISPKNFSPRKSGRKSDINSTLHHLFKEQNDDHEPNTEKVDTDRSIIDIPDQCHLPSPEYMCKQHAESRVPFYSLNELVQHNHLNDAWICLFGQILNLTPFIERAVGTRIFDQFIGYAGQDLSHLFDEESYQPRSAIDLETHQSICLIPNLSLIESMNLVFWNSTTIESIGQLIKTPRWIRLRYVSLPKQIHLLQIDEDETLGQIALKLLQFNRHIFSYRWRYDCRTLDLNKTLTENGLINEENFHDQHGWRSDAENCSTILLDFVDDLTIG